MLNNERYTYDKVGNRLSSANPAGVWQYNDADQLLSNLSDTFTYDANGHTKSVDYANNTTIPDVGYVYNVRERLHAVVKTQDGSKIQTNRYDFAHRRIGKKISSEITYYLYSKAGIASEYNSVGNLEKGYLFDSSSRSSTNPVLLYAPKNGKMEYNFYHNDRLYSPQRISDSSGNLVWSGTSSVFGETVVNKESVINNLRFPGQYYDAEIDLNNNYMRDYSVKLGRYIQTDPIGMSGGINIFGYANQNSLIYYDSLGLSAVRGEWLVRPNFDVEDWNASPNVRHGLSINQWGDVIQIYFDINVDANVNWKVKCYKDSECREEDSWISDGKIPLNYHNQFPIYAINIYCLEMAVLAGVSSVGVGAGPVFSACNIAVLVSKISYGVITNLRYLKFVWDGYKLAREIDRRGPTAQCLASSM